MKKRIISIFIIVLLLFILLPITTFADDEIINVSGTYDINDYGDNSTITIGSGLTVTLTNTNNITCRDTQIVCGTGVTLTIDGISVHNGSSSDKCALSFTGSGNMLILAGESYLSSGYPEPGIKVEDGTTLEMYGEGKLTVKGGSGAAGIGSGFQQPCGNIIISGGYVYSEYGGLYSEPYDIGYGYGGSGGTLTISDDAIIFIENGTSIVPSTTHIKEKHNINSGVTVYGIQTPSNIGIGYYTYFNMDYVYDLSYNANGGVGAVPQTVTQFDSTTTTISGSDVLVKEGLIFAGWNTQADGLGTDYRPGDEFTFSEDTTLYATYKSVYDQGDGTVNNPYCVYTLEQLNAVRYYPNMHYIMLNDINMTDATAEGGEYYNNGAGFTPIPDFDGTFDGEGFTIRGLKIHNTEHEYVGLFGRALSNSVISNLGMIDSSVYGDKAGGICAYSAGRIEYSYNTGKIIGESYVGGIAGHGNEVTSCYNLGYIQLKYDDGYIGGIAGGGKVANCYNAGVVIGGNDAKVGGIVGTTGLQTVNCYNVGMVRGGSVIGELNEYTDNKLDGVYYIYVNDYVLGVAEGRFNEFDENFDYATQLTNEQMKAQSTFSTFDFDNVWTMNGESTYPYPQLQGVTQVPLPDNTTEFVGGNGLPDSPYQISTPEHLNNVRNHLHANYVLLNDIDMTTATSEGGAFYNNGKGFKPIGMDEESSFIGTFDGDGYSIIGLTSIYSEKLVGLFSSTDYSLLKKVDLIDMNLFGGNVGGLAGICRSTQIDSCRVFGEIESPDKYLHCAGGIVALMNEGGIFRCHSNIDIINPWYYSLRSYRLGGIVAVNEGGDIGMCCFTGSIVDSQTHASIGGIAGENKGRIFDCFSTGFIDDPGDTNIGSIVDYNKGSVERCYNTNKAADPIGYSTDSGSFSDCYYLERPQNSGLMISGAEAKTFMEMKQQATYENYDFANVWAIMEGQSLPVLRDVPVIFPNEVNLDRSEAQVEENDTLILAATVGPETATDKSVVWTSSNELVATVLDGTVTSIREGTATITATSMYGGDSDSCEVTVNRQRYFSGNGTQDNPYFIQNADDLAQLAQLINLGDSLYADKYYQQTADIDLSTYSNWVPIGYDDDDAYAFIGEYDGNGNVITNLQIEAEVDDWLYVTGLFGYVKGTVKNVCISSGSIDIMGENDVYVGSIVGYLQNGIILNCNSSLKIVSGTIGNDAAIVGGIVGKAYNQSEVSECSFSGDIIASCPNRWGSVYVGGIIGYIDTQITVDCCYNVGPIVAKGNIEYAGGIIGFSNSSVQYNEVSKCYNFGKVESIDTEEEYCCFGGIVGRINTTNITNCYNTGLVSCVGPSSGSGGIIGERNDNFGLISYCYNTGIVKNGYSGGIAGIISGPSQPMNGCYYLDINEISVGSGDFYANKCTDEQMKQQITFQEFDFINIWKMVEGEHYPKLRDLPFVDTLGVQVNQNEVELIPFEKVQIELSIEPVNATNQRVLWSTSDESVATVDDGLVTAVSSGSTIITITTENGGYTDTCIVNVVIPVTGVSLDKSSIDLNVGESAMLIETVSPSDATNQNVAWISSNEGVALVDGSGNVSAISTGTSTITATTEDGGYTAQCMVHVTQPVTGVSLEQSSLDINVGGTVELIPTVEPVDASNKNVIWSSGNEGVATVIDGNVTAHSVGEAIIKVTTNDGGHTATCTVNVVQQVTGVELNKTELMLAEGESGKLSANLLPNDATNKIVTWTSSNTSVATVTNGTVSAVSEGTSIITVITADGGFTDSCTVTVKPAQIDSSVYSVDRQNGYLKGVDVATSVSTLKSNLANDEENIKVYDASGNEYSGSLLSTGMTVKLIINNTVYDELKLVMLGDANGDGYISITDYTLARLDILGLKALAGEFKEASDVNEDGIISITDYTLIRLDILGLKKIH